MKSEYYKRIEKYLYNFYEPEILVQEVRDYYISKVNISKTTWLKGSNTMENQVVRMMDSKQLNEIKRWLMFLKETLVFFEQEKPRFYEFICLKYFRKLTYEELTTVMKLDKNQIKDLRNNVISEIYTKAVKKSLIKL